MYGNRQTEPLLETAHVVDAVDVVVVGDAVDVVVIGDAVDVVVVRDCRERCSVETRIRRRRRMR